MGMIVILVSYYYEISNYQVVKLARITCDNQETKKLKVGIAIVQTFYSKNLLQGDASLTGVCTSEILQCVCVHARAKYCVCEHTVYICMYMCVCTCTRVLNNYCYYYSQNQDECLNSCNPPTIQKCIPEKFPLFCGEYIHVQSTAGRVTFPCRYSCECVQ